MAQYYLVKDGQRVGPMSVEQLLQNQLTKDSLVWTEGMATCGLRLAMWLN